MQQPAPTRIYGSRVVRRGFTMAELLLVIGLIALLISLILPALSAVNRKARQVQTGATLASIATALDQYVADFGDIPRFGLDDSSFPNPLNSAEDRGARLLARAMFGPAPANDNVTDPAGLPDDLDYAKTAFQDGHGDAANPFGFKEKRQLITRDEDGDGTPEVGVNYPGKVFSYLDPEKFLLLETADTAWQGAGFRYGPDVVMLDTGFEKTILYYPGLRKQPDISKTVTGSSPPIGQFVDEFNQNQPQLALYNSFDNRAHLTRLELRRLLGDASDDGVIGAGEQAMMTGPYLLIAVGTDGLYNFAPVANFQPVTSTAP